MMSVVMMSTAIIWIDSDLDYYWVGAETSIAGVSTWVRMLWCGS